VRERVSVCEIEILSKPTQKGNLGTDPTLEKLDRELNMWKGNKTGDVELMTEGKGFCRRRQERKAQEQVKRDLANLDKIVVIESKGKRKRR
jgi:hypothetical protein